MYIFRRVGNGNGIELVWTVSKYRILASWGANRNAHRPGGELVRRKWIQEKEEGRMEKVKERRARLSV